VGDGDTIARQVNWLKRHRRIMPERGARKESGKQIERMIARKMEVLNERAAIVAAPPTIEFGVLDPVVGW